ncbi:hypothetical protein EV361DRAFT_440819 [Lentinula raphanica]|nr:hypothetical protein EV361DRAFT_440819 [Lentinula raphanica]
MRWKNRADKLDALRKDRKAAILNRLEDIGWRDEAEKIMSRSSGSDSFSTHKLVKQPKKLTEHGWRSIKDSLVEFLSRRQAERQMWDQRIAIVCRSGHIEELYDVILCKTDVQKPFPPIGDILYHQVF